MIVLCLFLVGVTPIFATSIASITQPSFQEQIGVVIGKRYLLFPPAAISEKPLKDCKVRVGSLKDTSGGLEFDIKAYVAHPFYDPTAGGKGRTGKDNKDNIALVVVSKDLPIGHDNVDQANLADSNAPTEGPAYVLKWGHPSGKDFSRTDITIHSKADCEIKHTAINCTRNLWASASDTCDIERGAPVFSGDKLIGTIATNGWCSTSSPDLFINSIPHFGNWIRRTIDDEETFIA